MSYKNFQSVKEGKTLQTVKTSQTGSLYLTVISAPSSELREEVARHLKYWPYVKFFKYQGDRHLLCCFCLGEAKDGYQLKQLYERSRQLVLLCLRQYDVTITRWKPLPTDFRLFHNNKLFTRPEDQLRPFITFMGDSGGSGFMFQDSSTEPKKAVVIQHPASVNKKILSTLNWIKALFFRFPKLSSLNPHPSTL